MIKQVDLNLPLYHPGQAQVFRERQRFNVVNCGRRWGKTVLARDLLLGVDEVDNGAVNGFPVAYFAPTYKMTMDTWRAMNIMCRDFIKVRHTDEMYLELYGGGTIRFWSLDNPDSARGPFYKRAIVDEAAIVHDLKYAWNDVIRATLVDLEGDGWLFSTPKGKLNYFWDLAQRHLKFDNWAYWQMPTASNPHIKAAEIEEARLTLDPVTFAQEWLASFVTDTLDSFAYCYNEANHNGTTQVNPRLNVYLSFDFNKNPITCGVFQHDPVNLKWSRGIEQIKLPNSDIYKLCDYIRAKYGRYNLMITGDATGKGSSALVQDNLNYYTVIKKQLSLANGQIKVPTINPRIKENRVLVNSFLYHADFVMDKENCKALAFDLEHARVLPDGGLDKTDRNDPTKQLDALDCFRYYLNTFFASLLKA